MQVVKGFVLFCRYLISQGANVGVVNSEGETPLDIAEEEAMEELLQNEINRQGTVFRHSERSRPYWTSGSSFPWATFIKSQFKH